MQENIERGRKTLKFCRKISKTKCSSVLYLFMDVGTSEVAASPVFLADIVFIDEKKKKKMAFFSLKLLRFSQ